VLPNWVENFDRGRCCKNNGWRKLCDQTALQLNEHMTTFCHFKMSAIQDWECLSLKQFQKCAQSQLTVLIKKTCSQCDTCRTNVREAKIASTWLKNVSQKLHILNATMHCSKLILRLKIEQNEHCTLGVSTCASVFTKKRHCTERHSCAREHKTKNNVLHLKHEVFWLCRKVC